MKNIEMMKNGNLYKSRVCIIIMNELKYNDVVKISELLSYCESNNLVYCEDSSKDNTFLLRDNDEDGEIIAEFKSVNTDLTMYEVVYVL